MIVLTNSGAKLLDPYRDVLSIRGFNRMVEAHCTPVERDIIRAVQRHGTLSGAAYELCLWLQSIRVHLINGLNRLREVARKRIYPPTKAEEVAVVVPIKKAVKKMRPLYIAKTRMEREINFEEMADLLNHRLAVTYNRVVEITSCAY